MSGRVDRWLPRAAADAAREVLAAREIASASTSIEIESATKAPPTFGRRFTISLLCATAAAISYAQRYGIAIAIVRMQSRLNWSRSIQGQILASFFLGYMVAQLPAGWAAARYGARITVLASLLCGSIISIALPPAALIHPWLVMLLRLLHGLAQGVLFPGFAALWSMWAPPLERSQLDGIPRAGGFFGAMLCNALAGTQCDLLVGVPLIGDWSGVFTAWGLIGLAFSIVWWRHVEDSPAMDRTCSAAEAAFIAQEIRAHMDSSSATCDSSDTALSAGRAETSAQNDAETSARRLYGHIFRSSACWAICLAHTAGDIGLYVLDDGLPPYLRDVKGVELSQIGLMLALPGLLKPCIILLSASLADRLRRRFRTLHVRKAITIGAFIPQIGFLFALATGLLVEPKTIGVAMVIILPLGMAANGGGYAVNHLDIAPTIASLVLAFYNTGGQVAGWMAPWAIGVLTAYPDGQSREQHLTSTCACAPSSAWVEQMDDEWRIVFGLGGLLQAAGGLAFLALASDRVQPWVPRTTLKTARESLSRGAYVSTTTSSLQEDTLLERDEAVCGKGLPRN